LKKKSVFSPFYFPQRRKRRFWSDGTVSKDSPFPSFCGFDLFFSDNLLEQKSHQQKGREKGSEEDAPLQVIAERAGCKAHHGRARTASQIPGQGQEGEESGAAPGEGGTGKAKAARPHDTHGQPAEAASN